MKTLIRQALNQPSFVYLVTIFSDFFFKPMNNESITLLFF